MSDPKKDVVLTQKQEAFFSRLDFEETVFPFLEERFNDSARKYIDTGKEEYRWRAKEAELLIDLFKEAGVSDSKT